MKLGQKNLTYSMLLAGIMLVFLAGYFSYMLPSLYVDYCMEQNVKSIRRQHQTYMNTGTYEGVQVKNATACFSIDIPLEGNRLRVTGKFFSMEIELKDERLIRILQKTRENLRGFWTGEEFRTGVEFEQTQDNLSAFFRELSKESTDLPIDVQFLYNRNMEEEYFNEEMKIHSFSDTMAIIEAGVEDTENKYSNYMAVELTKDRVVLSILPTMTPDMNEIRPIVLQSIPMLGAVLVLVVLLFSWMYSRGIVSPIVELSYHAEQMKHTKDFSVKRLSGKWDGRQDEIQELAGVLDDFYDRIREDCRQLEEKNQKLKAENERQEVFLRASAHQLKTPVAAAILLTDGMIHKVGKYRDTETTLPRVREQLFSMRKMVEEILYLSRCVNEMQMQTLEVKGMMEELLRIREPVVSARRLEVVFAGDDKLEIYTDERMFSQIMDNLLSNAVKYTPEGERIVIGICREKEEILIENFGVRIPEELLPHILEPFVCGNHDILSQESKSHGLGLYIASYFAEKLGIWLSVGNGRGKTPSVAAIVKTGVEECPGS